jgi:hypothetical protein
MVYRLLPVVVLSEDREQRSEDRIQISDAGNQIARAIHCHSLYNPPASSIVPIAVYILSRRVGIARQIQ